MDLDYRHVPHYTSSMAVGEVDWEGEEMTNKLTPENIEAMRKHFSVDHGPDPHFKGVFVTYPDQLMDSFKACLKALDDNQHDGWGRCIACDANLLNNGEHKNGCQIDTALNNPVAKQLMPEEN